MAKAPSRATLAVSLLTVGLTTLSAIAINYATNLPLVPGILRPIKEWPWFSAALLTMAALLTSYWGWRAAETQALYGISSTDRKQLRAFMTGEVNRSWIKSLLASSTSLGLIEPEFLERPDAVLRPYGARAPLTNEKCSARFPLATLLSHKLNEFGNRLLVLGDQGSGKTTALLMLVQGILKDSETAERPIPVVFLLSRWKPASQPLRAWIAAELQKTYGPLSRAAANDMLKNRMILPVLDGLDEVPSEYRDDCIAAINDYADGGMTPPPLIVSCRTRDYSGHTLLNLGGCVVIAQLSDAQIGQYLDNLTPPQSDLLKTLQESATIPQLFRTPLLLNLLSTVRVQDRKLDPLAADGMEQVLAAFAEWSLDNREVVGKSIRARHDRDELRGWLMWLSRYMEMRNETLFKPDALDISVLSHRRYRNLVERGPVWGAGVAGSIVFTTEFELSGPSSHWRAFDYFGSACLGVVVAFVIGYYVYVDKSELGATLVWKWSAALGWIRNRFALLLFVPLTTGAVVGIVGQNVIASNIAIALVQVSVLLCLRGLSAHAGMPNTARPDGNLNTTRHNIAVLWLLTNVIVGLVPPIVFAIYSDRSTWLNASVDTAFVVWMFGADSALFIIGLMLLLRIALQTSMRTERISRQAGAWAGVALGATVAYVLDQVLHLVLGLHPINKWIESPVLIALLLACVWASTKLSRLGRSAVGFSGGLSLAYATFFFSRLLRWILATWSGSPLYFAIMITAAGITVCLRAGGKRWVRQEAIRNLLARDSGGPRNLAAFLDDADNRGLLYRVGSGYMFPHRSVQEYFAGKAVANIN